MAVDPGGLEETYIRESHAALMAYIGDRKYPAWLKVVALAIALAGAALGVAIVVTASGASDLLYEVFVAREAIPANSRDWMLAASLGLIVVATVSINAPLKMASSFWPAFAEYAGRNSILFVGGDDYATKEKLVENRIARAKERIEGALRRGTVGAGRPFDPAEFLRQEAVRFRWTWLAVTIILILANIWLFDRAAWL